MSAAPLSAVLTWFQERQPSLSAAVLSSEAPDGDFRNSVIPPSFVHWSHFI